MILSLNALEEIKSSAESIVQMTEIEKLEGYESLRSEAQEVIELANKTHAMLEDLERGFKTLKANGYSQEWFDTMNADGNFAYVFNVDALPRNMFGGAQARTEAAVEGLWQTIKQWVVNALKTLWKIFNWIVDKAKAVLTFWARPNNGASAKVAIAKRVSDGIAMAVSDASPEDFKRAGIRNEQAAALAAARIPLRNAVKTHRFVMPDLNALAFQASVCSLVYQAVASFTHKTNPGSAIDVTILEEMHDPGKDILEKTELEQKLMSAFNVCLSQHGIVLSADNTVKINENKLVFPKLDKMLKERTVEMTLDEYSQLAATELPRITASLDRCRPNMESALTLIRQILDKLNKRAQSMRDTTGDDEFFRAVVGQVYVCKTVENFMVGCIVRNLELATAVESIAGEIPKCWDIVVKESNVDPKIAELIRHLYVK